MKTSNTKIIVASIALLLSSYVCAENNITQVDLSGHSKKVFQLTKEGIDSAGQDSSKKSTPSFESQTYSGQEAVDFLGDNFSKVASDQGYEPATLKKILLSDPTIRVDKDGKLVAVDEIPENSAAAIGQNTPVTVKFTGDATKLHSKPGAKKIIFLDVDGFDPTSVAWGNSTNNKFMTKWGTSAENIYQMWTIVAEDYAPFDVDVTTEEPLPDAMLRSSVDDQEYGFRVVITDNPITGICGACGGIAYIGSVNDIIVPPATINIHQPALVFPAMLGNDPQSVAYAVSHEAGHALKLTHDGLNGAIYYPANNTWGPIMGAPYGAPVVQWSKGEYAGANNFEDDILIISQNFPVRTDNVPDDLASAPAFETASLHLTSAIIKSVNDIIESETDKDVYSFTTSGGDVNFTVVPVAMDVSGDPSLAYGLQSGNLNPKVAIIDENNVVVAVGYNWYDYYLRNKEVINTTLSAGKYYLVIEGSEYSQYEKRIYTKYGSVGQYTITGSYTPTVKADPPTAAASVDITSGTGPLTVNLNSDGSVAGYGSSLRFTWIFDDGSPDETGATASHTFKASGLHTATLVVMNDADLVSKSTVSIDVKAPLINIAKVKKMAISLSYNKKYNYSTGTVTTTIINEKNKGIASALICGFFDGSFISYSGDIRSIQVCGVANKSGAATIKTPFGAIGKAGTMSFTITKVESNISPNLVFDKLNSIKTTALITK